ncbi:MAG: hypothetical protein PHI63_02430 [Patescibacteria group bacterium]|nr:hypothetical protein [Patescibacteria group bacterium]
MKNMECGKCGGSAEGFKCEVCGDEMSDQPQTHGCGADRCLPKCTGCNETQTKCTCL